MLSLLSSLAKPKILMKLSYIYLYIQLKCHIFTSEKRVWLLVTVSTTKVLTDKMCHFVSCQPKMRHRESFQCSGGLFSDSKNEKC